MIVTDKDHADAKHLFDIIKAEAGPAWYVGMNGPLAVIDVQVDLARVVARFRGEQP